MSNINKFHIPDMPEVEYKLIEEETTPTALNIQEGGDHYKKMVIQPIEFIHANKLGYCEANVVKYITRWRDKNGLEDLMKVKHYVDLLIELECLENVK